jgi:hypothetical protein
MKSAHRHELQTNALAQRLEVAVQQFRPYVSAIAGVAVAVAVAILIWSYMSSASASRQGDAWNAYNQAIGSSMVNLDDLQRSAEEYPGTKMQELANITWADGQVWIASQNYIHNRLSSKTAMERAVSAYSGILGTTKDESLRNRAHLGMARIYEMRGELEKARDEYLKVRGGYEEYAKAQADRFAQPEAKDVYAWLEKAMPPRAQSPTGPGRPGQRPEFSAADLTLPEATSDPGALPATVPDASIDELLKGLGTLPSETGEPGATEQTPAAESAESPAAPADAPGASPSSSDAPAADSSASPPADTNATPPPAESNTTEEKSAE